MNPDPLMFPWNQRFVPSCGRVFVMLSSNGGVMVLAILGAIVLGVLSTLYDFTWAHFEVRHSVLNGIVHGMTLLSVAGLILAWPSRRFVAGLIGGAAVGLLGALSFYGAYPLVGYVNALVAAWMVMWLAFATLASQVRGSPVGRETALRGLGAAVLSGIAFYLISGIWTDHNGQPNYLRNFASWTFAFFPGFAALLFSAPAPQSVSHD